MLHIWMWHFFYDFSPKIRVYKYAPKMYKYTRHICILCRKCASPTTTYEIVLILVVLVALVLIIKDKIIEIINKAYESITSGTDYL